jgi:hypothetical protein
MEPEKKKKISITGIHDREFSIIDECNAIIRNNKKLSYGIDKVAFSTSNDMTTLDEQDKHQKKQSMGKISWKTSVCRRKDKMCFLRKVNILLFKNHS